MTVASGTRQLAFLGEVEDAMRAAIGAWSGPTALAALDPILAGGKRLRPLLVLAATPVGHVPGADTVRAAAAVELLHTASLVHDDILDAAGQRRGRPTVVATHGASTATHAGDLLTSLSLTSLTDIRHDPDVAASDDLEELVTQAVRLLAHTTRSLVSGEAVQAEQERRPDTGIDAYATRCSMKTGVLFGCSMAFGALFGRAPATDVDLLFEVGTGLGVAFQISDDVLDCVGDAARTGKQPGTDVRSGTMTLPLLLCAQSDPEVAAELASPRPDVDLVLERVAASGAADAALEQAGTLLDETIAKLDDLELEYDFDRLRELSRAAVRRSA